MWNSDIAVDWAEPEPGVCLFLYCLMKQCNLCSMMKEMTVTSFTLDPSFICEKH